MGIERFIDPAKSNVNRFGRLVAAWQSIIVGSVLPVSGFCLLTAVCAQVRIPLPGTDVPMTLQLLAVLLTGLWLAPVQAVSAMVLYLVAGAAGLPVFTPQSAGLFGSTGGYLFGFVLAAWVVSVLGRRHRGSVVRLLFAATVGTVTVFVMGVGVRAVFFAGDLQAAALTGFWPFVSKAAVELALAVLLCYCVDARRSRRRAGDERVGT